MTVATAISASPPDDPILDWSALVGEGRACLETMTDSGWTDFNAHDPGITILELVAYALTDFGYRASHPVCDLMAGAEPLPGPAESLTTRAVTRSDMRRLGLDVAGARNVWIEPSSAAEVRLRHLPGSNDLSFEEDRVEGADKVLLAGVHRVLIEKSSLEDLAGTDLARAVAERLHAERNLGEDFDSFTVLEPEPVVVAADLEIDDSSLADSILLDVFGRLEACLSPGLERTTIAGLRVSGEATDRIYDGPLTKRGIVTGLAGLEKRRRVLHLSDVVAVLASPPGVRATRRVRLGRSISEAMGNTIAWSLPIDDGRASTFDVESSRIRLLNAGAVAVDSTKRPDLVAAFASSRRESRLVPAGTMVEPPQPAGRDRKVAEYRPLRLDLPLTYGVRPGSLPGDSSRARQGAANQLRAYLAIFDALLANLFAQLGGVSKLLSTGSGNQRSYFAQVAEPPSSEARIVSAALDSSALEELVEATGAASAKARRSRFLGHLLARFGETVPAVPKPVAIGFGGDSGNALDLELQSREAFLGSIARLGSGRGSGCNLLADGDESPLLERIRLKLGLPQSVAGRLLLVEHILLRGMADDVPAARPLLSAAARADPYSLQLSFVIDERLKAVPEDGDSIARVIREECPAHLVFYVRWLAPAEFDTFAEAYQRWLDALHRHRREQLGIGEP